MGAVEDGARPAVRLEAAPREPPTDLARRAEVDQAQRA